MSDTPRRHRLRFSLRTLLLLVLLIGSSAALYRNWAPWRVHCQLQMPTQIVVCAEFSPDGKFVVTPHDDQVVRIFDAETGALVKELKGHTGRPVAVAYSPDGKRIYSTGSRSLTNSDEMDRTTHIWDAQTGAQIRVLQDAQDYPFIGVSPDGSMLATVDNTHDRINLWDASGETLLGTLAGSDDIYGVSFSPDSKRLVSSFASFPDQVEKTIHIFDIVKRTEIQKLERRFMSAAVSFSHDGSELLICEQATRQVSLYNSQDGRLNCYLTHPWVWCARYSPDGQTIVTTGNSELRFWDAKSHAMLAEIHSDDRQIYLSYSPDGTRLAISDREGVKIWQRQRPENWWGIFWRPESWSTLLIALALAWSLKRKRSRDDA